MSDTLEKVQQYFRDYLVTGQSALVQCVKTTPRLGARRRCDIYRQAYRARLQEILSKDFPTLQAYLGEEAFDVLTMQYVNTHVSTHFSIAHYGDDFIDFMATQSAALSCLQDLARLDRAINLCIEAPQVPLLDFDTLRALPASEWASLFLTVHPSLIHFETQDDVIACWEALAEGKAASLSRRTVPARILVWCADSVMSCYLALEGVEKIVFEICYAERVFERVCEMLCAYLPEDSVAPTLLNCLQRWVSLGIFVE